MINILVDRLPLIDRAVLFDDIEGRVNAAGVKDWIRFNTVNRWASYDLANKFYVTAHDHEKESSYTELFDYVVVSGHLLTQNMPYYKVLKRFNGRILHAHDFRDAREFTDQDI